MSERTDEYPRVPLWRDGSHKAIPPEPEAEFWLPDVIYAYRGWRIAYGAIRGGYGATWEGPVMSATCRAPRTDHPAPDWNCECGIYATKRLDGLIKRRQLNWLGYEYPLVGLVALSGLVIEHERGYRAERVEVLAISRVDADAPRPNPVFFWKGVPVIPHSELEIMREELANVQDR